MRQSKFGFHALSTTRCFRWHRARRAAVPAFGELAFERLVALRAAPVFVGVGARGVALQKLPHQGIGVREADVVDDPDLAKVGGQFADTAREKFTTHDGLHPVRFEIAADQVRFGGMACGMQRFHACSVAACTTRAASVRDKIRPFQDATHL